MNETKPAIKSRTMWGLAAAAVVTILNGANIVHVSDQETAAVIDLVEAGSALAAILYAGYGRVKANKQIGR